jgi:hypothetical protein
MLDEAGFVQTGYRLVGFGTVAIHYGVKPARPSRAESRGARAKLPFGPRPQRAGDRVERTTRRAARPRPNPYKQSHK